MFCRNCGKETADSDKFCKECGANLSAGMSKGGSSGFGTMNSILSGQSIIRYIALAMATTSLILLFQKWIAIPGIRSLLGSYGVDSEYSLLQISSFIKSVGQIISQYSESSGFTFIGILLYLLGIITLLANVVFCYKLIMDYRHSSGSGSFAFVMSIILPTIILVAVLLINRSLKQETYDLVQTVFKTTRNPVILLIIGAVGKFFILKMMKTENGAVWQEKQILIKKIICSKCGKEHNENQNSCPHCGYRKPDSYWVCKNCGSNNNLGILFCKGCGKYK